MREVVIVSGARTPIGVFDGAFKHYSAADLGAAAIKSALERANVRPDEVDEVLFGNVLQAEESGYAPRLAALRSGIPKEIPVIAINRVCSSGLEAINFAANLIMTGEMDIAVAGGTENMSQTPYLLNYRARLGIHRPGEVEFKDGLLEGLTCPVNRYHMGVCAENITERYEISREDQDELALMSHQRAVAAMKNDRFTGQIVEIDVPQRGRGPVTVTADEGPMEDTSLERLSRLRPAFKEGGTVTAGNSSSINDGAAAVVIMSQERASAMGIKAKLRWHARGIAGVDPAMMGIGPVPAVRNVLKRSSMTLKDIGLIELNEAFAVQALYCIRELGLDMNRTNVNGSGISMGHPLGATGAVMTVKLMDEMELRDVEVGLVTMCVGGGQGVATIFERAY